tara:strand:+ start:181 stop:330 length:150 start_codon:yes stop_codon:yes gene_type:complete
MTVEDNKSNTATQPNKISKEEADIKGDFAQGLDDEITDVVDYGDLGDKE